MSDEYEIQEHLVDLRRINPTHTENVSGSFIITVTDTILFFYVFVNLKFHSLKPRAPYANN